MMTHICVSVCLQSSHFSAGGTLVCLSAHPLVPAAGISECKHVPVSENARVSVYLFVNESVGLPVSFTVRLTPIHTVVFPCPYPDAHPPPPPLFPPISFVTKPRPHQLHQSHDREPKMPPPPRRQHSTPSTPHRPVYTSQGPTA